MQEPLPRRYVGYVRVSTEEQARSGLSLQAQRERLAAWATAFGHELVEVISDEGESAKSLDRPGMQRVLQMIDGRHADGVVVAKLDRLTRSTRDLLDTIDRCERRRVALASVSESLDTSTACGRLLVTVLGAMAQMEREQTAERTAAALGAKRRQGRRYCRHAPFGYRFDDGGCMVEVEAEQRTLDAVADMLHSGRRPSLRGIAQLLAERGMFNRDGKVFNAASVAGLVEAVERRQGAAA
jgi:site-specific DNA recombinase